MFEPVGWLSVATETDGRPGCPPRLSHGSWTLFFNVALRPQRPWGLLGTGNPGRPPRLSHGSWTLFFNVALRPQRPWGLLGTGNPGRPPRLSHSSYALPLHRSFIRYPLYSTLCVSLVGAARSIIFVIRFVTTNMCLSWQNTSFVATKVCLSRVCRNKVFFFVTKLLSRQT